MLTDFRHTLHRLTTSPRALTAWRALLFFLVAVILYLALSPAPPRTVDTGWDKSNHALAFSSLMVAGYFGYASTRARLLWVWASLLALGCGIEVAQLFVPSRSAEVNDVVADAVGLAIGTVIAWLVLRLARGRA